MKKPIITALLLALFAGAAHAGIKGAVLEPAGAIRTDSFPSADFGFYVPTTGKMINRIGYWDEKGDGLATPHTVVLYRYNGSGYAAVANVTIPAGTAAELVNGYRWVTIPDLMLDNNGQGADYYILVGSTSNDPWTTGLGVAGMDPAFGTPQNGWFDINTIASAPANHYGTPYGGPNIGYFDPAVDAPTVTYESNTTNVWTFPAGNNLLASANPHDLAAPAFNHGDVTSQTWATLTDGSVGNAANFSQSVAPNNATTVIYDLNLSTNANGYNLTSLDTYAAWSNSGRDNQDFTVFYSTVAAPDTFIPIAAVQNHTSTASATHTRIAMPSGFLATNVAKVKFNFDNQENGYVGYREFILLGSAVPLGSPLTWTGLQGNGSWIAGSDNNWKGPGGAAPFNPLSPVTFDSTGTNTTINVPTDLGTADITLANGTGTPYAFTGQQLTVGNNVTSVGAGSATFNNPVSVASGVSLTGSGSLTFANTLQSPGLNLTGSGTVTLAMDNTITGITSVGGGTLILKSDNGLALAPLSLSGGTARFTSSSPSLSILSGSGGSIVLGDSSIASPTTLYVGATDSSSYGGGITDASAAANGSLYKVGSGTLLLSGTNTYTGTTTAFQGILEFGTPSSLYNGVTASWSAANLLAQSPATIAFRVGGAGDFTNANLAAINTGGFDPGSFLGIDTATVDFTLSTPLSGNNGLLKTGPAALIITGANTYTGPTVLSNSVLVAANPSGVSLPGNVVVGDGINDAYYLNMGAANQFGPGSILSFVTGSAFPTGRMQMRGFNQTLAGLESGTANRVVIIQNDEASVYGYTTAPGPVTLTLNTATDHSFYGIIRDQAGVNVAGPLSLVKNGPGTQELGNLAIQGYGYSGPTTINQGNLRLNFNPARMTGFSSNVTIAAGATLELRSEATTGSWNFLRKISGAGQVVKTGVGYVTQGVRDISGLASDYTGNTDIQGGILKFFSDAGVTGDGSAAGQFGAAGLMSPANVITARSGATMGIGGISALGGSALRPQFANTINILPGARVWGGNDVGGSYAFLANLTLDGATVEVMEGNPTNGFNTNMALVGTVVIGGTGGIATTVITTGTGPYANISLGSAALPGTTFQVADATGNADPDFIVGTVLRDVGSAPSFLNKTGPGTMSITGASTYTGTTHVSAGKLAIDTAYLADRANVTIDTGATLALNFTGSDSVGSLTLGGVVKTPGLYGAVGNTTPGVITTPLIEGTGTLNVLPPDAFTTWSAQISDPAQRGRTADPDHDGFTNLQEFLFGSSPNTATGSLSQLVSSGSNLVLHWNQRATGTSTYVVKESTDLATWTTSTITITNSATQDLPDYTRKEAVIPVSGTRKFYRIEATE